MNLTESEKKRIAMIRKNIAKHKKQGWDVGAWESVFFLRIIDREKHKK